MKEIILTRGMKALVDDEDYEWLNQWKWCACKGRYTYYAERKDSNNNGVSMHRLILGMTKGDGKIGDHKNQNGLDNQRHNLREATIVKNKWNTKHRSHNTSGYRGLYWFKKVQKWNARITANGKTHSLGLFFNREDAARAYDRAARKYHKEFAVLNFP